MKALLFAITLASTIHAQEAWLYTPDRKVAEDFVLALDKAAGYPNPPTRTYTSVDIQTAITAAAKGGTNRTNYLVLVPSVFAPKLSTYLDAKTTLPSAKQTALTNDAAVATELGKVSGTNKYVLVSTELAESTLKAAETNVVKEATEVTK